ncbi:hypothetical protein TNCT_75441 [Trichonephila clavata]|uniref:Uncharacterized protein n=1 Tax=Trichonephila clavata TaxID=2740835 RepID=A0A8X6FQC4_TRICU|nr:hypothetical protein TNCT_75441 [Trichonephila clavata]
MDNLLYFRILDIASLLGKRMGPCLPNVSRMILFWETMYYLLHNSIPTTARVQLVTRNAALHIIGRKNKKLAKKLSNALETGYAYVQGKRTFECSYKQSPKLVVVDCPIKYC